MLKVLAVDPGVATGWSLGVKDGKDVRLEESGASPQLEFCVYVDALLGSDNRPDVVVSESFVISARTVQTSPQPASLEIIGTLRYLCHKHGVKFAALQSPGSAKSVITDAVLKRWSWSTSDHIRDSYRHLLLYMSSVGARVP